MIMVLPTPKKCTRWIINSKRSGAEIVVVSLEGIVTELALRFEFSATNNEAKYEAMIMGLK